MLSTLKQEARRWRYATLIAVGRFRSPEPEYDRMTEYVKPGHLVVDVGANVGHYTRLFSKIVGDTGEVYAFEPMAPTFWHLANHTRKLKNAHAFQAAASERADLLRMGIPEGHDHYWASVGAGDIPVLAVPLDALGLDRLDFLKVDAEGHEPSVLAGARELIERHRPIIMLEDSGPGAEAGRSLEERAYAGQTLPGSPNVVWTPR